MQALKTRTLWFKNEMFFEDLGNQIKHSTQYRREIAKSKQKSGSYLSCEVGEYFSGLMDRQMHARSCASAFLPYGGLPAGWTSPLPGAVDPKVFHEMFPGAKNEARSPSQEHA